jgi:hypothetical protein
MPLPFLIPLAKLAVAAYATKKIREHTPIGSLEKSFVDNVFRDKVTPIVGSILHCSMFGAEHTGVYIGSNKVVELTGNGTIRITSPAGFIDGTNAISIYVACDGTTPLGGEHIAERAQEMVGRSRVYNVIMDNCHQFTAGCISGDFENSSNFFTFVESSIKQHMNHGSSIQWRVWDI